MALVRRARVEDAKSIHEAHMRSICEICSQDHSEDEILGWGHRAYNEQQRLNSIKNHLVWVVESKGKITGFGEFIIKENNGVKEGRLEALYLTPEITGQGFGKKIIDLMVNEARAANIKIIKMESTISAHSFYKKLGFSDCGPQIIFPVNGIGVRCFPMELKL